MLRGFDITERQKSGDDLAERAWSEVYVAAFF